MSHDLIQFATAFARCGCSACACLVEADPNCADNRATVTGDGSRGNPYRICVTPDDEDAEHNFYRVQDAPGSASTTTGPTGTGTEADPFTFTIDVDQNDTEPICVDQACGALSGNGTAGNCLTLNLSGDACNDLDCRADGLYVHVPNTVSQRFDITPADAPNQQYASTDPGENLGPTTATPYTPGSNVALRFMRPDFDGLNPDPIDLGQFTNPDQCCPMMVTVEAAFGNVPTASTDDICSAITAYRNAAGADIDFDLRYDMTLQSFIDGAPTGTVQSSRVLLVRYNPSRYGGDCGVQIQYAEADNEESPFTIAAGATVDVQFRIFHRMGTQGPAPIPLDDPRMLAFVGALFRGIAPYPGIDGGIQNYAVGNSSGILLSGTSNNCGN